MASYQEKEFTFLSSDGKNHIAAYLYTPTDRIPRAVVQIAHGVCDYIRRYLPMIEALTAAGFAVCGADCLGHGRSARHSDDLGYFAAEDGVDTLVTDAHKLTLAVRSQLKGTPVVLLGHSMGSFLARLYAVSYSRDIEGAILLGTANNRLAGFGRMLANRMAANEGENYRSEKLKRFVFGPYNRKTGGDPDGAEWLTRDDGVVAAYLTDPYCNFILTARAFADLFRMLELVSRPSWAKKYPKSMPTLIAAGAEDPVGACGKGPHAVAARLESAGASDVTLKLYEGARHELHNEISPTREEFFEDLVTWLAERF